MEPNDNNDNSLLEQKIEKSIKTTMIGSLYIMEENFTDLLDDPKFIAIFSKVRAEILRLGNNNIRVLKKELENYNITYNKNVYKFHLGKREGKNE